MGKLVQYLKSIFRIRGCAGTVRFMFPAAIAVVAMLSASVINSTATSYIRLQTPSPTIEAGKQFSIDVYAYAHEPVNAVDITLSFDSRYVEVVGVDRGQSVLTIWTQEPVIKDGTVLLQGGTFRKGFIDEHLIAKIQLRGKQTGSSDVKATDVILLAGDGKGTPVRVTEANSSTVNLFVYDENTTPDKIAVEVKVNVITDIDGDGKVTLKDISAFMAAWHSGDKIYDFNGDGRMTFRDFSILLANFLF